MPRGITLTDSAIIERRLWTPKVLNPIIWLDAADPSSFEFGTSNQVSNWKDKGSSQSSFTQATSGSQPSLVENSQNYLPGVNFQTGTKYLQGASTIWSSPPISAFIVVKVNGAGYQGFIETSVSTGLGLGYSAANTYAIFRNNVQDFPFNLPKVATDIVTYNTTGIDIGTASTTVSCRRNGTNGAYSVFPTGIATTGTSTIGAYLNGTNDPLNGILYEIVIANRLDLNLQYKTEGYLAWKWGLQSSLTINHPYRFQLPLIDIG